MNSSNLKIYEQGKQAQKQQRPTYLEIREADEEGFKSHE